MNVPRGVTLLGLALTLAACGQQAQTPDSRTSPAVTAQTVGSAKTYLVGFKPGTGVNSDAIRKAGGQLRRSFDRLEAASAVLTPAQANKLAQNTNVEYVELTVTRRAARYVTPDGDVLGKPGGQLGGLNVNWQPSGEDTYGDVALGAPALRARNHTGTGTAVCVGDTGIDATHPEFANTNIKFKNFMGDGKDSADDLNDVDGHGTHVTGTIFAQLGQGSGTGPTGMDANGVVGLAPGVNLYFARVLGDDGSGTSEGVVEGVMWCVDQLASQGRGGAERRMVINLSLGSDEGSKTEKRAFQAAYDAGALVVAAAGNDGVKLPHYPSDYPSVVKVGAVDHRGNLAGFSNYNSKQELVAPGVAVLSSVPRGTGLAAAATAQGMNAFASVNPMGLSGVASVSGTIMPVGGNNLLCAADDALNLSGKIALISRGTCTFALKVANALKSGAIGVIVYNNVEGPLSGVTVGSQQTIPVVGITRADGLALAAKAGTIGVPGSVSVYASDYEYFNGTSMATPHVAAAAAVVWSAKPTLTNAQLRELLSATATDLGPNGRDNFFGNGLVNPTAAIAATGRN